MKSASASNERCRKSQSQKKGRSCRERDSPLSVRFRGVALMQKDKHFPDNVADDARTRCANLQGILAADVAAAAGTGRGTAFLLLAESLEYVLDNYKADLPIVIGVGDLFSISADAEEDRETREIPHSMVSPIRQRYLAKRRAAERGVEHGVCTRRK